MGGGPSLMYAADAISAYEQFQQQASARPDRSRVSHEIGS
jgi:hypothetical protein